METRYFCSSHEEKYIASCMDCEVFLCQECLLTHDLNEKIAYFSDYMVDNFKVHHKLGEGGFGKVYKVSNLIDSRDFAIKVFKDFDSRPQDVIDLFMKEVRLHSKLSHKNII